MLADFGAPSRNRSRSNTYDTAKHASTSSRPYISDTHIRPICQPPIRDLQQPGTPRPSSRLRSLSKSRIHPSNPNTQLDAFSRSTFSASLTRRVHPPRRIGNSVIHLPPPHELSVPVASPQASEQSLPPLPPSRPTSEKGFVWPQQFHTRDYAYPQKRRS